MSDDDGKNDGAEVISIKTGGEDKRVYERTIQDNRRRYRTDACEHRGPYIVDRKLASVECGDCGALLNPIYVLEMMAAHETYWNIRQRELAKYLGEITKEIEGRTRTRCTHCGNMTVIKFKGEMPRTWFPEPY